MADDSNPTTIEVDVNTDNLDEFEQLFHGKATAKTVVEEPVEEIEEEVNPVEHADATEDEDVPEDEDTEEAPEEEKPEDILKPKGKKTFQERMNEQTRKLREAERREADLLRRFVELEQRVTQKTEPEVRPQRQVIDTDAPTPDDRTETGDLLYPLGEFDPLFIRDLTRYTIDRENKAYREQLKKEEEAKKTAEQETHLTKEWETKLEAAEQEYDDLRPTIASLDSEFKDLEPSYGTYLAQTIMSMDIGPQVLYYLANNVDEARKIVASGPTGATLALGRLEARIQGALAKKATPVARKTQAPQPPIVTRGNGAKVSVPDDTDDLDAFEAKFFKRK